MKNNACLEAKFADMADRIMEENTDDTPTPEQMLVWQREQMELYALSQLLDPDNPWRSFIGSRFSNEIAFKVLTALAYVRSWPNIETGIIRDYITEDDGEIEQLLWDLLWDVIDTHVTRGTVVSRLNVNGVNEFALWMVVSKPDEFREMVSKLRSHIRARYPDLPAHS